MATLVKIGEHTTGLPEDSPVDARLRDCLELVADVLDAVSGGEEHLDLDRQS